MGYYYQLKQFLDQAKTGDLKTKHFDSEYRGTKVVVSFGQGAIANVPWISFLKGRNTTQEGIYPAYLYFKDLEILILAYGVSETRKPHSLWRLVNAKSIKDFFVENYNKDPYRYGSSFIYKVYDAENLPFIEVIESDLDELIKLYDSQYEQMKNEISITSNLFSNEFIISKFQNALASAGLTFSDEIITRFVASLITKPFVILTGLSGSGKTKLAQAFVQWICKNNNQYKIVPVGAD